MKVIIHLHSRRPTARTDALHFLQREHAIAGGLLDVDAQFSLTQRKKVLTTLQQAADIGANLHVVLAARLSSQHGVVADHIAYFEIAQIQSLPDFVDSLICEISNFILNVEQYWHQYRPLGRIMRQHLRQPLLELV